MNRICAVAAQSQQMNNFHSSWLRPRRTSSSTYLRPETTNTLVRVFGILYMLYLLYKLCTIVWTFTTIQFYNTEQSIQYVRGGIVLIPISNKSTRTGKVPKWHRSPGKQETVLIHNCG